MEFSDFTGNRTFDGLSAHITRHHAKAGLGGSPEGPIRWICPPFQIPPMPRRRKTAPAQMPASPELRDVATPVPVYALWTEQQAAKYLCVSPRYLRQSACPKVRLPGNGVKQRESVVRYRPHEVIAWAASWSTRAPSPGAA